MIVFVGYTATADKLSIERPRDTLFSVSNLFQIAFMFIAQLAGQILSVMIFQWVENDYYNAFGGLDNNR
jgi:hypothetical protein